MSKYIKQFLTDVKAEIDNNKIIVGDFSIPFTPRDRSCKQKINRETLALSDTLDQMDLVDIDRTFHPRTAEYTFFFLVRKIGTELTSVANLPLLFFLPKVPVRSCIS